MESRGSTCRGLYRPWRGLWVYSESTGATGGFAWLCFNRSPLAAERRAEVGASWEISPVTQMKDADTPSGLGAVSGGGRVVYPHGRSALPTD